MVKPMKSIILTGPKHSGKTSTGKALASIYSFDFIDLDELILQRTGKTPRQLYIESGICGISDSSIFKQAEAEAVSYIMTTIVGSDNTMPMLVIAAGGGIIDNPEALTNLKNSGAIMVYLNISAEKVWNRIAYSSNGEKTKELPPFLKTENPQKTHRLLHERRAAAYLQIADIVIEAENKTPEEIAKIIQSNLEMQDSISTDNQHYTSWHKSFFYYRLKLLMGL